MEYVSRKDAKRTQRRKEEKDGGDCGKMRLLGKSWMPRSRLIGAGAWVISSRFMSGSWHTNWKSVGCVLRQHPVPVIYETIKIEEAFKADLIVNGKVIVELKSMEEVSAIHGAD